MKVYITNTKQGDISGGHTFYRNFKKGMAEKVHFVHSWQECDIFFITGVTITNKEELYEAKKAGKKIVLRVDNVPRKSRNRRSSPHERLKEFAELSDVVIYQSQWAKDYCYPLCGDGTIIYNGVDQEIFKVVPAVAGHENRYLFAYHGNNEHKGFWHAHYYFQQIFRNNRFAEFWFIYDFKKDEQEMVNAKFDFWNGENYKHISKVDSPEKMAKIMNQCSYLIYPAICDASPNTVLEARACGLEVIYSSPKEMSGTQELMNPELDISLARMCEEYFGVFQVLIQEQNVI